MAVIHLDREEGGSGGGGNPQGSKYLGLFTDFNALVLAYPAANYGDSAKTENSQGTAWLPFTFGGTYYPEGDYVWDGLVWTSNTKLIAQELNKLISEQYKVKARAADIQPNFLDVKILDTSDIYKQNNPPAPAGNEKIQIQIREYNKPYQSTINPTVNDDSTPSFRHRVGQTWINTVKKTAYTAISLGVGTAVWKRISLDQYNSISGGLTRSLQTTIGLINQQANILEEYISMTFTPKDTGNFTVSSSFSASLNHVGQNLIAQATITDGASFNQSLTLVIEPKDEGGAGPSFNILQGGVIVGSTFSGTDNIHLVTGSRDLQLTAGVEYTFNLQWGASLANIRAALHQATLSIKQNDINE